MDHEPVVRSGELAARTAREGVGAGLAAEQQTALESLMSGKSVAETARAIGLARSTVFRWIKDNVAFQAAYNEWRESLKESCRARLLAMTDKAADVVQKALDAGDAKSAMGLLKGMGMVRDVPVVSIDPQMLKQEAELERRLKAAEIRRKGFLEGM